MKKKFLKPVILIILCALLFSFVSAASGNTVVYITDTGDKYHTSDCGYLRNSKHRITLRDAVDQGYTPCSVCDPPTLYSSGSGTTSGAGYSTEVEKLQDQIAAYEEDIQYYEENWISKADAEKAKQEAVAEAVQKCNGEKAMGIIWTVVIALGLMCVICGIQYKSYQDALKKKEEEEKK